MSYKHLAREERFLICMHLQVGCSLRRIARMLGRSPSTVCRKVKRNRGKRGYRYKQAEETAKRRRREASSVPRKMTREVRAMIKELLLQRWSPEQICGRLRLRNVAQISPRWVYHYILADREAGGTLYLCLRRRGKKPDRRGRDGVGRGLMPGRVH